MGFRHYMEVWKVTRELVESALENALTIRELNKTYDESYMSIFAFIKKW